MYLTFCQFRKRKMVQSRFQKLFWNQDCDVVGNLVVEIENFNFCLFVCLLFCLYLTFCQFRKRKMVQSWFQKLFWNQGCGAVLNLAVEFSNWIFVIVYCLLFNKTSPSLTLTILSRDWKTHLKFPRSPNSKLLIFQRNLEKSLKGFPLPDFPWYKMKGIRWQFWYIGG